MHNDNPPAYEEAQNGEDRLTKFKRIMKEHKIGDYFAGKIRQLEGFEIVVICDDSTSMRTPLKPKNAYDATITRWDELCGTVIKIVDIASLMDSNGIDLYFLNRGKINNVKNSDQVRNAFVAPPEGGTNISRTLREILHEKEQEIMERKLLVIIATDGIPTNDQNRVDTKTLENILRYERKPLDRIFVSFLACTDDDSTMEYLNKWDTDIDNVDVCDDYESEKIEVLRVLGHKTKFTYGDYVVKCLIGSIDPEIDKMDEMQQQKSKKKNPDCVIL